MASTVQASRALVAVAFVGICGVAEAYQFRGARWIASDMAVPYEVNNSLAPNLPDEPVLTAIRRGFFHWQDVNCSYAAAQFDGRTENAKFGVNDNHNVVSWRTSRWGHQRSAIAVTSTFTDFTQRILDSDMVFNDFNFDFATDGISRRMDIEAIATHEAGHFFGMGHADIAEATMFPTTGPGNPEPRSLHDDDIAGICKLYPSDSVPGEGTGEACSDVGGCAVGLLCRGEGDERYCTTRCEFRFDCSEGYFCVRDGAESNTCLRFPEDGLPGAGIGDACGLDDSCQAGLECLTYDDKQYCSGRCDISGEELVQAACPSGYECKLLRGGRVACVALPEDVEPPSEGEGEGPDEGEGEGAADADAGIDDPDVADLAPGLRRGGGSDGGFCATGAGSSPTPLALFLRR